MFLPNQLSKLILFLVQQVELHEQVLLIPNIDVMFVCQTENTLIGIEPLKEFFGFVSATLHVSSCNGLVTS